MARLSWKFPEEGKSFGGQGVKGKLGKSFQ